MSSPYKDFIKNNSWTLLGQVFVYAQGLFLLPIIIKNTGADTYGSYVLVITTLGVVFGISSFGIGYKCKRYLPSTQEYQARSNLFYPQFAFQAISLMAISAVILLIWPVLANWLHNESILLFFPLIPIYLFLKLLYSQAADYYRSTDRINYFNVAIVAMPYLNIAIIGVLLVSELYAININTLIVAQIIAHGLVAFPLMLFVFRELGFPGFLIKAKDLWSDLQLGFPLVLVNLVDMVLSFSDRYLIAFFIGVIAVGYYSPAYTLGTLIVFFPKVSGVVLPPLLSHSVDNGREYEAKRMVDYTIKGFLLIGIPFVIGSIILSKPLLVLLANHDVAENAYLVTPFVAMGTIFYGLNIILSNILFVRKKTGMIFWTNLVGMLANSILNVVLLYVFKNIILAGITTLLGYFITFITLQRRISDSWKVDYEIGSIIRFFLAAGVMAIVLLGSRHFFAILKDNPWSLLVQIILGGIVYTISVFIFKGFSRNELARIWRLIH